MKMGAPWQWGYNVGCLYRSVVLYYFFYFFYFVVAIHVFDLVDDVEAIFHLP